MNLGCGPDIKEGWVNVDIVSYEGIEFWDIVRNVVPKNWENYFDYILVNHTFCLLSYDEVDEGLLKLKSMLKEGGMLEVIDMDTLKAFDCMQKGDAEGFAGQTGYIEEMMCKHLVGYGRKSIYTPDTMGDKLRKAGFKSVRILKDSEHDLRPKESLIVKGLK